MKIKEYAKMHQVEDCNWWYVGLRELTHAFISKYIDGGKNRLLLDAGCGTGGMLAECSEYNSIGLDISGESIKFCKLRNLNNLLMSSISDIPFKDNIFDMVISLDVLSNIDIENNFKTLKEIRRIMAQDAILLLNLPAYNFLMGRHDMAYHAKQRYTLRYLKAKVERAGFTIERITYRNTLLFPLTAAIRIIEKISPCDDDKIESDMKPLPTILNNFLKYILMIENRAIIRGLNLPFGLSVYCVARKKTA